MTFTKRFLAPILTVATLCFAGAACGGGSGSSASFCDTVSSLKDNASFLDSDGATPGSDEFDDQMKTIKGVYDDLQANAPDEIADDIATLSEAMNALAGVDFTDTEALMEASSQVDSDKLDKATENVSRYAKDECGVDLDA